MTTLTEDQARGFMHKLLAAMSQQGGSDLFISADFPPSMKAHGVMTPLTSTKLTGEVTRMLAHAIMNEEQRAEFAKEMECNFAISIQGEASSQSVTRSGFVPANRHRPETLKAF